MGTSPKAEVRADDFYAEAYGSEGFSEAETVSFCLNAPAGPIFVFPAR